VAISEILVVYNADTGEVVTKPTRAAKEPINAIAFAKDGKTFATARYALPHAATTAPAFSGSTTPNPRRRSNPSSSSHKMMPSSPWPSTRSPTNSSAEEPPTSPSSSPARKKFPRRSSRKKSSARGGRLTDRPSPSDQSTAPSPCATATSKKR
jgi:hypothetical protein